MRKLYGSIRSREGTEENSLMSLTLANALVGYTDIDTRYQPVMAKTFIH